ncbi:retrovirus-related pol polyprotein from transposon TNT 1-94 [Tanacetum coccineum]
MAVPISTREPNQNVNQYVNQYVATSSKKTVATDSTVKKSRNITLGSYMSKLVRHVVGGILNLEVAFRMSTCYILDLKGNDLLTGSRGTDLYSITLQDSTSPNPICLMAKATSSQAWLWHRRLSHLNFQRHQLSFEE